jgi:hypothetical protein
VHFHGAGDDRYGDSSLSVLQNRSGTPRVDWTPPAVPVRTARPAWTRFRRHFGAAIG